jgi:hypothetical protein
LAHGEFTIEGLLIESKELDYKAAILATEPVTAVSSE